MREREFERQLACVWADPDVQALDHEGWWRLYRLSKAARCLNDLPPREGELVAKVAARAQRKAARP